MKRVKIKDLQVGDIVLDRRGIQCLVTGIKGFDDDEMLIFLNDLGGGPPRIGSSPKEEKVTWLRNES